MSSFTDPLDIRVLQREKDGAGMYQLLCSFRYYLGSEDGPRYVLVPMGFETDLASVPRPFRWLISPGGLHAKAAVVHDYLYEFGVIRGPNGPEKPTRKQADDIFLEAMEVLKVPYIRRHAMYRAVRMFGGPLFD
ncbi:MULTISPECIES: DUF1353 domain-containing protein [Pseudovibrio]|uniref:DUF1353 domain-containing protein n=1 Tax=Stappiaceae TaxID=2821832 RepID=UPI0023651E2A|nr:MULTISPECIES: DUF1353 domain-containing protein [Pseudovibrio]MDD7911243.1 DUF1353 domain-containing protein [Pseudovibrio exalbescens]MDX5593070.1 DUF1353 domain-containing protein [Pseudovibrio sp. SPO723]